MQTVFVPRGTRRSDAFAAHILALAITGAAEFPAQCNSRESARLHASASGVAQALVTAGTITGFTATTDAITLHLVCGQTRTITFVDTLVANNDDDMPPLTPDDDGPPPLTRRDGAAPTTLE